MFITHPPRQTRHKRLVSARTATPTPTRPRATDAPQANVSGTRAIVAHMGGRYSAGAGASLAPTGRGLERFLRHAFRGLKAALRG